MNGDDLNRLAGARNRLNEALTLGPGAHDGLTYQMLKDAIYLIVATDIYKKEKANERVRS